MDATPENNPPRPGRDARRVRLRGGLALAVGLAVVAVGLATEPNRAGVGSHRGLGLPACGFLSRTGYPCPGCGVTTSLAWAVRGRLAASLDSQLFGLVLLAGAAGFILAGLWELCTARAVLDGVVRRGWWLFLAAVAMLLVGWGVKLWVGLAEGRYPIGR
jgi:hypothetical protein